jgi:hypothetical protein
MLTPRGVNAAHFPTAYELIEIDPIQMGRRKKGVGAIKCWINHILVPCEKGHGFFTYPVRTGNKSPLKNGSGTPNRHGVIPPNESGALPVFIDVQCRFCPQIRTRTPLQE